jgi:peptidoglycan hydrolase-like amidase
MPRPIVLYVQVSKNGVSETNWISQSTFTASASDNIRIGLSYRGNPVISADGTFKLFDGAREMAAFTANEKVSVVYDQLKYQVKGYKTAFALSSPPIFKPIDRAILRIDNYENRPAWNTSYNDNEYQGNLEVHYYENELQVVNELPLEDYLKGLAEISATEHFEKIKAIIVLARSYAKYYMTIGEKFPGAPYHLSDDPARSQKYLGYGFTKRNITGGRAVENTKGQVVTYNGKIIKTPYFSSSDGRTRSAYEVWGWTDTPYLVSVDDPGCAGHTLNGHGVGLSGCGAQYLANQGTNYREIIKYYFKGVEISP